MFHCLPRRRGGRNTREKIALCTFFACWNEKPTGSIIFQLPATLAFHSNMQKKCEVRLSRVAKRQPQKNFVRVSVPQFRLQKTAPEVARRAGENNGLVSMLVSAIAARSYRHARRNARSAPRVSVNGAHHPPVIR